MEDGLTFNMCRLDTSFKRNRDIPDFDKLVNANVPLRLLYACRYWTYHVSRLPEPEESVVHAMTAFFQHRFLQWLEVMSISKSSFQDALRLIHDAKVCFLWANDTGTDDVI
jgi:hypothetical protein